MKEFKTMTADEIRNAAINYFVNKPCYTKLGLQIAQIMISNHASTFARYINNWRHAGYCQWLIPVDNSNLKRMASNAMQAMLAEIKTLFDTITEEKTEFADRCAMTDWLYSIAYDVNA